MIKIEVTIIVWQDGLFKLRDRIKSDDIDSIEEQIKVAINSIREKLDELDRKKYTIGEDDDIPF